MTTYHEIESRNGTPFSLLVATPSHRGSIAAAHLQSIVALQALCHKRGFGFAHQIVQQISNIDFARNLLATVFLNHPEATHLLFVDDDMGFPADELAPMFDWRDEAEVVAAMYPRRQIDWERVKQVILAHPDIPARNLPHLAGDFENMWQAAEATDRRISDVRRPVPVNAIVTGLMLISRECLTRLLEKNAVTSSQNTAVKGGKIYEFFKTQVIDGKQTGEDYFFCNLVRRYGGRILGCPWITVNHIGQHTYIGDLTTIAAYPTLK